MCKRVKESHLWPRAEGALAASCVTQCEVLPVLFDATPVVRECHVVPL